MGTIYAPSMVKSIRRTRLATRDGKDDRWSTTVTFLNGRVIFLAGNLTRDKAIIQALDELATEGVTSARPGQWPAPKETP